MFEMERSKEVLSFLQDLTRPNIPAVGIVAWRVTQPIQGDDAVSNTETDTDDGLLDRRHELDAKPETERSLFFLD
jgi:hypothetical protein